MEHWFIGVAIILTSMCIDHGLTAIARSLGEIAKALEEKR